MNTRNRFTITLALSIVALALIAIAPARSTRAARNQTNGEPRRQVNATPPVTLGDGQTFHVTYLNVGSNPFEIVPCVFDGDGAHLKTGDALRLAPGQMRSFDLSRAEAGRRTEPNVAVRAGVHVDDQNLKHLSVSGEVVEDATGKSTIFMPGLRVGFDPQPDPPGVLATSLLSPVGITFGQTLHITFLNTGDNPFAIDPCVFDDNGVDVKEGSSLTLAPGQMRSFDVSRSEVGARTDVRVQLRAEVHVARPDLKNLVVTGEVIEDGTGKSSLFVPGLRVGFDPQPDPPSADR